MVEDRYGEDANPRSESHSDYRKHPISHRKKQNRRTIAIIIGVLVLIAVIVSLSILFL
ncbi:MAG: hypothetical protein M0Z77_06430 [Thermoplasmatales archaeon]|nr:hypothetical protein [Candidatus Thermoplasmatota archaeon]MCL6002105.1 hypothetical protein [Candidatus Thermoplasmatota archaeon]MDA8055272.1 hypothetical protein [Thermoplasmatales archaeon]